jgi:hypothetical protein
MAILMRGLQEVQPCADVEQRGPHHAIAGRDTGPLQFLPHRPSIQTRNLIGIEAGDQAIQAGRLKKARPFMGEIVTVSRQCAQIAIARRIDEDLSRPKPVGPIWIP